MTRVTRTLTALALVALATLTTAQAQTGVVVPDPKQQFFDNNGDPLDSGTLCSFAAGTTTPLATFTDSALSVAHPACVALDAAGRATIYLNPTLSYKFDLRNSAGASLWVQDNIIGSFSGVLSITTADTRGLRISRSAADAGLSVTSSGGSGKTYGLVSGTDGGFTIRDDSDGTPNMKWLGNNITATTTGVFAVAGNQTISGTLGVTGAATLSSTLGVTGTTTLTYLTTNGPATFAGGLTSSSTAPQYKFYETDSAVDNRRWDVVAVSEGLFFRTVNDAESSVSSWLNVQRTGIAPDYIEFTAPALYNTGRYQSATLQPGFLAYNSAIDSVATGGTVDFDTEVYDEAGNFAADTFTAPVTGRYHLCTTVFYSDNSASSYGLRLVTSARTYQIDWSGATSSGVSAGCVYADMTASHTAYVQVLTGDLDIDIDGGAAPLVTFFSGRLVP